MGIDGIILNLEEIQEYVNNELPRILLGTTPSFEVAAFILQAVLDALDNLEKEETLE